jgi:hypothetical protein
MILREGDRGRRASLAPARSGPPPPSAAGLSSRNALPVNVRFAIKKGEKNLPLRGSAPIARRKGLPQSSVLRLCRPAFGRLRFAPVGTPLPLRLATPAFARWRSACTCRVSTRKCKGKSRRSDANHNTSHTKPLHMAALRQPGMGDHLLGEDTVDLASLGFCGDTLTVSCPTCGEVLGNIPVELLSGGLEDLTTRHIIIRQQSGRKRFASITAC